MTKDQYIGCFLGLALGDSIGAPHEGGPIERALWWLIGKTKNGERRWTDDTQMSLDLAESLIKHNGLDPDDLAGKFASSYRWSRGYGPGAAKILKRISRGQDWREANVSVYSDGSFGNGAAMRAPIVGLYFAGRKDVLVDAARLSARVTHAHPHGIEGAVLLGIVTAEILRTSSVPDILDTVTAHCGLEPYQSRLSQAASWLKSGTLPTPRQVARQLGNGIAAVDSVVTAIYLALRFLKTPFMEMIEFVIACGGDTDTIGAMSGALWGAASGHAELPQDYLTVLEQWERIVEVAGLLYDKACTTR